MTVKIFSPPHSILYIRGKLALIGSPHSRNQTLDNSPSHRCKTLIEYFSLGSLADYAMHFTQNSVWNYARVDNVFPDDITSISSCFWIYFERYSAAVYSYSSKVRTEELMVYLYSNYKLDFIVGGSSVGTT